MLPRKVLINEKEVDIDEYCKNHCPERYDSECRTYCSLEMQMSEEMDEDDDDFYEYEENI